MRAALTLSALLFSFSSFAAPCGRVLLAKGEVEVIASRSSHLIRAGQSLECGDVLVSRNGAATIEIAAGKMAIGSYSRLEIADVQNRPSEAEVNALNLIYGKTRVLIQKKRNSRFEVRTPSATAGVRGTDFFVSHDPEAHVSHEATIEGQVEVARFESTEPPVLISAGQQVDVSIEPEEKDKPLKEEKISAAIRKEIRDTSGVAKDDPDFTHRGATKLLGSPNQWETGGLEEEILVPKNRITVGVGPQWGTFLHNTASLDGQVGSGPAITLQYERAMKNSNAAWLFALSSGRVKERDNNSYGVRNDYQSTKFEAGVRFDHAGWWSPFVKLGVGWIRDRLTIERSDINYFIDRDDKGVMLLGSVGLDARYDLSHAFGLFGKMEAQFGETLFTVGSSTNSFSGTGAAPDAALGNGVRGTSVTLSAIIGVMGQF